MKTPDILTKTAKNGRPTSTKYDRMKKERAKNEVQVTKYHKNEDVAAENGVNVNEEFQSSAWLDMLGPAKETFCAMVLLQTIRRHC